MRTIPTLWAAALAVVSFTGPFTTAEAAPARLSDTDRQLRPVFRKRSFNDTDSDLELRNPDPILGVSVPPILPPAGPTNPAHHKHAANHPKHDHSAAGGFAGGFPSSSSSYPASWSALPSSSSAYPSPSTGGFSLPTNLPGITSDVNSALSKGTGAVASVVTSVVSDVTHHRIIPTGAVSSVVSDATSGLSSVISHATQDPTSVVSSVVSQVTHGVASIVSHVPAGFSGAGIGHAGTGGLLGGVTGKAKSILSSVGSQVTSAVSSVESAVSSDLPHITNPMASLESSLASKLSQISLTATNPGLVSELSSGFSSILSNVGSTLSGATSDVGGITTSPPAGITPPLGSLLPTGSGPTAPIVSIPTSVIGSILTNPTGPVGSIITSQLSSILTNPTSPIGSLPTSVVPPIIPTTGTGAPIPAGSSSPTGGITITGQGTTVVVPVPTTTPGTGGVSTETPTGTTTPITTGIISSSPQGTGVPTTQSSGSTISASPSSITQSEPATSNSTTAGSVVTASTPLVPSTTSSATHSSSQPVGATIYPTGTDTNTVAQPTTSWHFDGSSTTTAGETASQISTATVGSQSTPGALETSSPRLVSPAQGMPHPGPDFSLIQIGFKFGLNYPFVVSQPESSMQIFGYLPKGIAHGLGIPEDEVKEKVLMNALMPYDTYSKLGYVTTLAQAYIPRELVDQLQLSIHTSSSPIYYNKETPVRQLMRMINPTIPIVPGSAFDGISPYGSFDYKAAAGAGSGGAGAPIGSDAGTTKKVRGTSVGIAGAAVAGSAVYVASMLYVARRYRQRRRRHRRASSVPTVDEMTQRSSGGMGSLFMVGANGRVSTRGSMNLPGGRGSRTSNGSSNGRSIREQGISAPLMSENSLGWN